MKKVSNNNMKHNNNDDIKKEGYVMKKIVYVVLAICTILTLGGCGRSEKRVETRDDYYMRLAEEVTTNQEVYDLIKEYSEDEDEQEAFKKQLALLKGNETVQYALLESEDLSPELLIVILENPRWVNLYYVPLKDYLEGKIKEAKLTPEQEVRIAQNCDYEAAHLGLLIRKNVCCEALCYIANMETTAIRNLNYVGYRDRFYVQAEREWTDEEKMDLMNTGNKYLIKRLK